MSATVCELALCWAGGPRAVRVGGVGAGPARSLAPLRLVGVTRAGQALPHRAREETARRTGV